jgi:2-polyprenyl-6-methoxyphenol hydroxylase-like FAD-dependent oxidoreductase
MIIIAGAGIGGLTLGSALARKRTPFRIFERVPELRPTGAGIALSSNAFQALAHIDIADQVRNRGWELASAEICDSQGRALRACLKNHDF